MHSARPYLAAFRARFLLMLQYRAAALAGFATQCWWGAIHIMVIAAFYGAHAARRRSAWPTSSPIPGSARRCSRCCRGSPIREIGQAVRTGGVGYDRLRPLDAYGYWYARTLGWSSCPRARC